MLRLEASSGYFEKSSKTGSSFSHLYIKLCMKYVLSLNFTTSTVTSSYVSITLGVHVSFSSELRTFAVPTCMISCIRASIGSLIFFSIELDK